MCFRCDYCNKVTKLHEKQTRVVIQTREHVHPYRKNANPHARFIEGKDDPGGKGSQIVKEVVICEACVYDLMEERSSETVA